MFHRKRSVTVSSVPGVPVTKLASGAQERSLELTVVFTTVSATLAALKEAGRLAHQLGAQIRILVPQVVPYPLPIQSPSVDPIFRIRKFRTLCCYGAVDTRIDVRLCRDAQRCVEEALTPDAIVLIGGRDRVWPTRAKKLVKRLEHAGHHAMFVSSEKEIGEACWDEPMPIAS